MTHLEGLDRGNMHRQLEPFCIYRNVETGVTSSDLRTVLPKQLTVLSKYRRLIWQNGGNTLFRGIVMLPLRESLDSEGLALFDIPIGTREMSYGEYLQAMVEELRITVWNTWDPEKFHVVWHSGGYDSRIMSAAICDLFGPNIDNVLFICFGSECNVSKQILEAEGWPRDRFVALDVDWIIDHNTDMHDMGRWINGVTLQSLAFNHLTIEYLQSLDLIPNNDNVIQIYNGRSEALKGATMPDGSKRNLEFFVDKDIPHVWQLHNTNHLMLYFLSCHMM